MADARAVRPYKQTKFQQQKRCVGILTHPLFCCQRSIRCLLSVYLLESTTILNQRPGPMGE